MARDHQSSLTDDESLEREEFESRAPETRGRPAERFVLLTAAGLALAGLALILVPTLAPQYGWAVQSLAKRGVTSLPLLVGGVILYGTWLSSRANRAYTKTIREGAPNPGPSIDKLAGEVAHLGDSLQGVRIEFVYLKDALQTLQERTQTTASNEVSADSMFRLAASLDQVGYRIEERVHANHQETTQALQAMASAIEALRSMGFGARHSADGEARATAGRRTEYESDASGSTRDDGDGWKPDEPGRRARLGLLDMLDDLGRVLPKKTSPALERPNVDLDAFDDARDEGWKEAGILPGPLPSSRPVDLSVQGPGVLLSSGFSKASGGSEEAPIGDKLTELRSLLADQRVRDALSSIERNRH